MCAFLLNKWSVQSNAHSFLASFLWPHKVHLLPKRFNMYAFFKIAFWRFCTIFSASCVEKNEPNFVLPLGKHYSLHSKNGGCFNGKSWEIAYEKNTMSRKSAINLIAFNAQIITDKCT